MHSQMFVFSWEGLKLFSKTMLNHIAEFITKAWLHITTGFQLKTFQQNTTRKTQDCQLVSSVPRCLQTETGMLHSGKLKFKLKLYCHVVIHEIAPPHLTHPGWHLLEHTCTGSHSQRKMPYILEQWAAIHSARGARCLAQGLPPHQLSVHQSLSSESGNRTANLQVIGRPTVTTKTFNLSFFSMFYCK